MHRWFENYVNYAGSKTLKFLMIHSCMFENYVNYAGSKTKIKTPTNTVEFENYVNYAGSKTRLLHLCWIHSLRTM